MELHDVIVVGAGPAGAIAAGALASHGLNVLVVDKDTFPREKPCAGWISPLVFELTGISPQEYMKSGTLISFSSLVVWDLKGVPREVEFKRTMGYGIIRSEFDSFLVKRMRGAALKEGVRVSSVERDGHGVVINGSLKAKVIIGAGGHFCPVAKRFGEEGTNEKAVAAVVSETRLDKETIMGLTPNPDTPEIVFNEDFSGYGWYFPKGEYLNIGVGSTSPKDVNSHKERLLKRLGDLGRLPDPGRYPLSKFSGHAYKLFKVAPRRLVSDRVILVGDSAGVAYNMTGEGIGPAIFSGLAAARTIIDAGGNYSAENLSVYRKRIYSRFGRPYSPLFLSIAPLIPKSVIGLLRRIALGGSFGRREIVAKRWFFRD